jgi:hypothetical protein
MSAPVGRPSALPSARQPQVSSLAGGGLKLNAVHLTGISVSFSWGGLQRELQIHYRHRSVTGCPLGPAP